jgi:predicted nucleic acid-binding protein
VAGAITRRYREGHLAEQKAREGALAWEAMLEHRLVRLIPDAELLPEAVQLAFLARHPLADCLYLAMAKKLALPVITSDKPMQERGAIAYENIVLLGCISAH